MSQDLETGECKVEQKAEETHRTAIPEIVRRIVDSCSDTECFDHLGPGPIPSRQTVIDTLQTSFRVLFPGYFSSTRIDPMNVEYYLGQEVTRLFVALSEQITLAVRHDCLRYDQPCSRCADRGRKTAVDFLRRLPGLRTVLAEDVRAGYEGDPAAKSYDEIIYCYPGLLAVTVYRLAHVLYEFGVPLLPRIMTEYAHSRTGIDIHPGARIGRRFFIDHGTGVVIGETTVIGDRVRLYQGVTLGALSLPKNAGALYRDRKRHPTLEDDVIIYAGATILGGGTVIGARSVVGGNVWLTESIPPDTKVVLKTPELAFRGPDPAESPAEWGGLTRSAG